MASLYFRRGAWELRYRAPSGKQRCERFAGGTPRRAPEEALDRRADIERDFRRNSYIPREAREALFQDYFNKWWSALRVSRTRTYTDTGRARLHVLPYWGRWRLCDIRPSDVDDWIAGLSDQMGRSRCGTATPCCVPDPSCREGSDHSRSSHRHRPGCAT